MNYLLIDTSNQPLSVAIMKDNEVIAEKTTDIKKNHSVQLMPEIAEILTESKINKTEITDIVVAEGPGSYTGLRIGVTVAKTLAYALNTNLYGVSSLKALASTVKDSTKLLVPIFDARREAVYAGVYQYQDNELITIIEKIKHLLDSDIVEQLPQASSMKQLIQKPENIHSFTPKYHKLSEAERNWLNQQENN